MLKHLKTNIGSPLKGTYSMKMFVIYRKVLKLVVSNVLKNFSRRLARVTIALIFINFIIILNYVKQQ